MGIQGLFGSLKSIQRPAHLREFKNKTVAVDAYGWLHRGAIACAIELATGKPTRKFVDFAMHRVRMLLHFGITPYLVFDGDRLPSKASTESARAARRQESKTQGMELLRLGKKTQAYQELQKAIDITPQMARMLIDELKAINVQYVVAPYEADSQMAYLERKGIVDAIASEDSDLLVFGAACLVTKLDQYGECVVIRRRDFTACREINLAGWTDSEFRCMAILNGCDYLDGIPRMGIKTAHRLVRKYRTIDLVLRGAQLEGKMRIPAGYLESYNQAETTFLHQWVFCPLQKRLVHFTQPEDPEKLRDAAYIGAFIEDSTARGVAIGNLDPMTKQEIGVLPLQLNPHRGQSTDGRSTHHTNDNVPAGKGPKSLHSFFKPQRAPLAELDPNSFRPSATQHQLLQSQDVRRGWTGVSAPAPFATSQQPTPPLRNALPAPFRTAADGHTRRQQLCGDDPTPGPAHKESPTIQTSPFFSSKVPSVTESGAPGKRRRQLLHFDVWSDEADQPNHGNKRPRTELSDGGPSAKDHSTAAEGVRNFLRPLDHSQSDGKGLNGQARTAASQSQSGGMPAALPFVAATATADDLIVTPVKNRREDSRCEERRPHVILPCQAADNIVVEESPLSRGYSGGSGAPKRMLHSIAPNLRATAKQLAKGSEDALVPESDIGSDPDERPGSSDCSDAVPPESPATSPFTPHPKCSRADFQSLDLTRFMYSRGSLSGP